MRIFRFRGKKGDVWGVDYRAPGHGRVRQVVGTKQQAELALGKIRNDIFEGKWFPESIRPPKLTMDELRELWKAHVTEARAKGESSRFASIIEFYGAEHTVASIKPSDVIRFRTWLEGRTTRRGLPPLPATTNRHLALFRSAMSLAVREGAVKTNPVHGDQFRDEQNERDRICSPEEYTQLIAGTNIPHLKLAITFGYGTGMRLGEIAGLTYERVDANHRIAHLDKTKNGRKRDVPLSDEAWAAFEAYKKGPKRIGKIFPVTKETLSSTFADLTERLRIKDLHFHDLRHTAATRMRRAGVDLLTLKRYFGWDSWAMVERYNHIDNADLIAAVDKVAAMERAEPSERHLRVVATGEGSGADEQ
jgi:integrase